MKTFDHYNVLSLIGVCFAVNNAPCIVMPYMSEGSLLSYLKRERPKLSIATNASLEDEFVNNVTKQLLSICLQVANGMEYLTMKRFIHRDLAARNCMYVRRIQMHLLYTVTSMTIHIGCLLMVL